MTPELATSLALILSFASFVTVHISLAFRLILRWRPRWQGWLTLLPITVWLAPYLGYRAGLKRSCWLWLGCLVAYIVAFSLAHFVA